MTIEPGLGLLLRRYRGGDHGVRVRAGVVLATGCAVLSATQAVPLMFAGYALVGGCVALVLIPGAILLQQATVPDVYTQSMTWINSASAFGIATSAPLVGVIVQHHGWPAGFLTLAALTAALPVTIAVMPARLTHSVIGI